MKEQEIGELFRENLAGYQPQPPAGLWNRIQQDAALKKFNHRRRLRRLALRVGLPAAVATVALVALLAFRPSSPTPTNNIPASPNTPEKTAVSTSTADSAIATTASHTLLTAKPLNHSVLQTDVPTTLPTSIVLPSAISETSLPTSSPIVAGNPANTCVSENPTTENPSAPLAQVTPKGKEDIRDMKETQQAPTSQLPDNSIKEDFRLIYSHDTMVCRNSKVQLYVLNADNVYWSFGSQNPTEELIIEEHTLVRADVRTRDGFDTAIIINIRIYDCELFIPSAFTPNGDGLNDDWMVYAPAGISDFECTVYDKGGHLLFRSNNIHFGWDGKVDGKYLPTGSYFYNCRFRDELGQKHVQKGQVTLVR